VQLAHQMRRLDSAHNPGPIVFVPMNKSLHTMEFSACQGGRKMHLCNGTATYDPCLYP